MKMESKNVKNGKDFIKYLNYLHKDLIEFIKRNEGKKGYQMETDWQNTSIESFIKAISSWLNSNNQNAKKYMDKKKLDWNDLAEIIEIGKVYE